MKLLTIHHPTHPLDTDFCWAIEGELAVAFGMVCDNPDCGCDRALTGLNSAKPSTTVMIRDLDIAHAGAVHAAAGFLVDNGWAYNIDKARLLELAAELMCESAEVAAGYPIGTVLRAVYDRTDDCWDFTAHTIQ